MADVDDQSSPRRTIYDDISKIQTVILTAARDSMLAVIKKIDSLYSVVLASSKIIYPPISSEIHKTIKEIFFHQSIVSTIMFNRNAKGDNESEFNYNMRIERASYAEKYLDDVKLRILTNKSLRHKLAHTDESIDIAVQSEGAYWFVDRCVGVRDEFIVPEGRGTSVGFCRCYVVSENTIVHLGEEMNLAALREEVRIVLARVFGIPTQPPQLTPALIHEKALAQRSQSIV